MEILWAILIVSALAVSAVVGLLLPRLCFRAGYHIKGTLDTGLKNYHESQGQTLVFQPSKQHRKYISQYILSHRKGTKIVVCKTDGNFLHLCYDIAVFDKRNKIVTVLTVSEQLNGTGYTSAVELPTQTAYICLSVKSCDDVQLPPQFEPKIPVNNLFVFLLLSAVIVTAEFLFSALCLSTMYGDVFAQSFLDSGTAALWAVVIGLAVCLVCGAVALAYLSQQKRNHQRQVAQFGKELNNEQN